mgnify:CR=1 FL=1
MNSDYKYEVGQEIHIGNFDAIILSQTKNQDNRKAYGYRCLKCGYDQGIKTQSLIEKGFGCPCCANRVVVKGINDITTTDPWMIPFFQGGYGEASLYSKSCGKEIVPKCPFCGRVVKAQTINQLYGRKGVSCVCGDGISFPNKIIYFLMEQLLDRGLINDFKREYHVAPQNKFFDIYFETLDTKKYFVEMDGGLNHGDVIKAHNKQSHFKAYPISLFRSDIEKDSLAKDMNIELIRIDCFYSDFDYIASNIRASKLGTIMDLDQVNWKEVEKLCYSNLVKTVCNYKKEHPDAFVKDAEGVFKLNPETIRVYWDKGNSLGWCKYDRKAEAERSRKARTYYGQSCRVLMINIQSEETFEFRSVSEFARESGKYFTRPLTRKIISNMFQKHDDFIKNFEGYNIKKLRRNCDGIC